MIGTGRVCGTSASSAPSVTTICTPSASASSTIAAQKVRQRNDGSGALQQHEVARRARHARLVELDLRPDDLARAALDERDLRARGLEVEELLGVDAREARRAERRAEKLQRRGGGVAGVVPARERADERGGAQAVRAAAPRSGAASGSRYMMGSWPPHVSPDPRARPLATACAPGPARTCDGVFACARKDRLIARAGTPYLALELRDRTRRDPGARLPRRRRARRALRARRPRARRRPRRALPRRAAARASARSRGRRADEADPAAFLPVAYRDLDELDGFLEHLAGEVREPRLHARCCRRVLGDERAARATCAARRARAAATTPTSAACSSTRSPSGRSRSRRARCTRASTRTCCSPPRSSTTSAGRASSRSAPRSALTDEGRLLGHVELGLRIIDERAGAAGLDDARRLALAHCVLPHHGADAAPGRRFALARGAGAAPPQRARREPSRARSSTGSASRRAGGGRWRTSAAAPLRARPRRNRFAARPPRRPRRASAPTPAATAMRRRRRPTRRVAPAWDGA